METVAVMIRQRVRLSVVSFNGPRWRRVMASRDAWPSPAAGDLEHATRWLAARFQAWRVVKHLLLHLFHFTVVYLKITPDGHRKCSFLGPQKKHFGNIPIIKSVGGLRSAPDECCGPSRLAMTHKNARPHTNAKPLTLRTLPPFFESKEFQSYSIEITRNSRVVAFQQPTELKRIRTSRTLLMSWSFQSGRCFSGFRWSTSTPGPEPTKNSVLAASWHFCTRSTPARAFHTFAPGGSHSSGLSRYF